MEVLFIVIQMTIELFFPFYFLLNAKKPCCIGDNYHVNEEFVLQENPTSLLHIFSQLSRFEVNGRRKRRGGGKIETQFGRK